VGGIDVWGGVGRYWSSGQGDDWGGAGSKKEGGGGRVSCGQDEWGGSGECEERRRGVGRWVRSAGGKREGGRDKGV